MPAIEYAHARYISRKGGGSATRSAAYNNRIEGGITDERTGQHHQFEPSNDPERYREKPVFAGVLLPESAPAAFKDRSVLWNAAEAAERRVNSQVAREVLIALPNDPEVTRADWEAMTIAFAREHFVSKGLAVQYDVHAENPDNPHAHLLITTRYVGPDGFGKKARDLHPDVRNIGGKTRVTESDAWGQIWREHQNAYFRERGYALRVDPIAPVQRERLRTRIQKKIEESQAEARKANTAAMRDPAIVLETLTRRGATFSEAALDRLLEKHLPDAAERAQVKAAVLAHHELVDLAARHISTGDEGPYTTRQRQQEQRPARQVEQRPRPGRISPRLDSRHNKGGGHYEEEGRQRGWWRYDESGHGQRM